MRLASRISGKRVPAPDLEVKLPSGSFNAQRAPPEGWSAPAFGTFVNDEPPGAGAYASLRLGVKQTHL